MSVGCRLLWLKWRSLSFGVMRSESLWSFSLQLVLKVDSHFRFASCEKDAVNKSRCFANFAWSIFPDEGYVQGYANPQACERMKRIRGSHSSFW